MANRSYLFMQNLETGEFTSLAEYNYSLPLAYCALCSCDVKAEKSKLFASKEPLAFSGDFAGGWQQLLNTLDKLKSSELLNAADHAKLKQETEEFFTHYLANPSQFRVWLEVGELFNMSEEALEDQSKELLASLQDYAALEAEDIQDLIEDGDAEDATKRSQETVNKIGYEWDKVLFYDLSKVHLEESAQAADPSNAQPSQAQTQTQDQVGTSAPNSASHSPTALNQDK